MIDAYNQVNPSILTQMNRLHHRLIDAGCSNCMIFPNKLEGAISNFLMKHPLRIAEAKYAELLTEHIKVASSTIIQIQCITYSWYLLHGSSY